MAIPYETHGYLYVTIMTVAIFLAFLIVYKESVRRGGDKKETLLAFAAVVLLGFLGANVFFNFLPWTHLKQWSGFSAFAAVHNIISLNGGLVWYGGVIFGILTVTVICRLKRISPWPALDIFMLGGMFALFIARIGCFLAGCCYGLESALPWAIERFGKTIHPTQIYMSVEALVIFIVLYELNRRRKFDGYAFLWALIIYPASRFFMEFLRYYHSRVFGVLTASQIISLILISIAFPLLILRHKKFKKP